MRAPTDAQLAAWGTSLRESDPATLQQDTASAHGPRAPRPASG